jgi:hypothetical protein
VTSIKGGVEQRAGLEEVGAIRGDSVDIVQYWDSVRVRGRFHGAIRRQDRRDADVELDGRRRA